MMSHVLVDTHCHLYLEDFGVDLPDIIDRASKAGVARIYMPAIDYSHVNRMLELEKLYSGVCYSMLGLHPCSVKENYRSELEFIRKRIEGDQFVAIGEIGLDYYWDRSYDEQQMIAFRDQIEIAREYTLPVVIHSRNSMDECIKVVRDEIAKGISGIFHCFTGTAQNAFDIIDCGMLLGIGGVITYKNSGLGQVIAKVPLEHIVLETDAPYLTPVPFRGKRNESSYLKYVVEKIAEVKHVSVEEVAAITTANADRVFGWNRET
jgi:TatD DNase family protein